MRNIFSLTTGTIYQLSEDELKNLDDLQIPLKKLPNSNCKQCYGRLYQGYDTKTKQYILCYKCLRKVADLEYIQQKAKSKLQVG